MSVRRRQRRRQRDARQVGACSRATPPSPTPAPRRAPTAARRARCAPGARPAPCPSFPIRARRCVASCVPNARARCATAGARCCRDGETGSAPRRCVAPISTARRPGVSHSTTGSTIVATIDPSETNRVRATTIANAAAAISRRHRRQHAEHAAGGRHAFAAAKPQPDRIDVPDHRRHAGGRRRSRRRRRASTAAGALRHVGQHHRDRHRQPARAIHVGGADVAAADPAQIDAAARSARRDSRSAASQRRSRSGWQEKSTLVIRDCYSLSFRSTER